MSTDAQRLAFANGLAWLLLRHGKNLTPKGRKFIEAVQDAKTVDEMRTASTSAYTAHAPAHASAAYAYASASVYVAARGAPCASAQEYAVEAGVPEHEVAALRMTIFGE